MQAHCSTRIETYWDMRTVDVELKVQMLGWSRMLLVSGWATNMVSGVGSNQLEPCRGTWILWNEQDWNSLLTAEGHPVLIRLYRRVGNICCRIITCCIKAAALLDKGRQSSYNIEDKVRIGSLGSLYAKMRLEPSCWAMGVENKILTVEHKNGRNEIIFQFLIWRKRSGLSSMLTQRGRQIFCWQGVRYVTL